MHISTPPEGQIKAVVSGLRLQDLDADSARTIRELIYEHKVVILRDQAVTTDEYLAAAKVLGTPQVYFQDNYHHPDHPEIFVSSNVPMRGEKVGVAGTGRYWHTDYQFFDEPLPFTSLIPQILPPSGRRTSFIPLDRAYETLPADLRAYADQAVAIHEGRLRYKVQAGDIDKSLAELLEEVRALVPPVTHPMVVVHPVNGRRLLYISRGFTTGIVGETHERSQELLERLFAHIEREERVAVHEYCAGDFAIWDNRQLLHHSGATPPGEQSMSFRIGIYDGLPFYRTPAGAAR